MNLVRLKGLALAPVVAVLALLNASPATAQGFDEAKFRRQAEVLRGQVEELSRRLAPESLRMRDIDLLSRWLDAKSFSDAGRPDRAAIALLDLVDDPRFSGSEHLPEALLLLGQSLHQLGNEEGARRTFERLKESRPPSEVLQEALTFLIEAAVHLRRYDRIDGLLRDAAALPNPGARLQYAAGKGFFVRGKHQQAADSFRGVGRDAAEYLRARYYLGTTWAVMGKHDEAGSAFSDVVQVAAAQSDEGNREVGELARMALGRLAMEKAAFGAAAGHYDEVPRESTHHPRALYEMAWAQANDTGFADALDTLDTQILVTEDPRLLLVASMDRGRMLMELKRYEEALLGFEQVLDRFVPIRKELAAFSKDDANLERYFDWLIHRYDEEQKLEQPLSDKAAKWIETGAGLERMVGVFDDIAQQRRDVDEMKKTVAELETALKGRDRVGLFPGLSEGWLQLLVIENNLIHLKRKMVHQQADTSAGKLSGDKRAELTALQDRAKELEKEFVALPQSVDGYRGRIQGVVDQFSEVQRAAFGVNRALDALRSELVAVERFIKEIEFSTEGTDNTEAMTREVREVLEPERDRVLRMARDLEALERELGDEMSRIGLGGNTLKSEEELKSQLLGTYRSMERLLSSAGASKATVDQIHGSVWRDLERVTEMENTIHHRLDDAAAELMKTVAQEKAKLPGYGTKIDGIDNMSRSVSREVGHALFRAANESIQKTVLQADLGVIDLAWEQKQGRTDKIEALNKERTQKIKEVRAIIEELDKGTKFKLEKPAPEKPKPADEGKAESEAKPAEGEAKPAEGGAK